jgi:hypothetical protein
VTASTSDYKRLQADLHAAARALMASVLTTPEALQSSVNTHAFARAVTQIARMSSWAAGQHESLELSRRDPAEG